MSKNIARNPDSTPADFTPLEQVLVVWNNPETHERESVTMRWGLVPSGAESPVISSRLTHARGKTVATKPVFQEAFRYRRCLIVVDSFEIGKRKAIQLKGSRPFGVGGIWKRWQEGGEVIESCVLITTSSNAWLQAINDRMPV